MNHVAVQHYLQTFIELCHRNSVIYKL